jgi:hypothetical protein
MYRGTVLVKPMGDSRKRSCLRVTLVNGEDRLADQRGLALHASFVDAGPRCLDRAVIRGSGGGKFDEVGSQSGLAAFGQARGALREPRPTGQGRQLRSQFGR